MLATHEKVPVRRSDIPALFAVALADSRVRIAELTPEIGHRASGLLVNEPMDPADQLVAATALILRAPLVTSDERLAAVPGLRILW